MKTRKLCAGGCGGTVPGSFIRCKTCLDAYRRSVDYRTLALTRDGHNCAKCWGWQNRAIAWLFATRWAHAPAWTRRFLRRDRPVEVDHIVPLGAGGTHDPSNLQVLGRWHHLRKTRVDIARMRGRRLPWHAHTRTARIVLTMLLMSAAVWRLAPTEHLAATVNVASVLVAAAAIWVGATRGALRALAASLAVVTGASATMRKPVRGRRWRVRNPPGGRFPRLTPTGVRGRFPHTFDSVDPEKRDLLERRLAATLGGSWSFNWFPQRHRFTATSPDPLVAADGLPWPNRDAERLSMWDPVPVGVRPDGTVFEACLVEKNLLIGGEPGSGKSVAFSMITASAALDPDCTIYAIDGKGKVEMAPFKDCFEEFIGSDMPAALDILGKLQLVINGRYKFLLDEEREKVAAGDGMGLVVLLIDELAYFTAPGGDTKAKQAREEFTERLRDVISRGRAAGVIVVAATQRPSADVVPTKVRDLVGFRWALRCTTNASSDMVLGQGQSSAGFSAARVPAELRGLGLILAEGAQPVRVRSFLLRRDELKAIGVRAARARGFVSSGVQDTVSTAAGVVNPMIDQADG